MSVEFVVNIPKTKFHVVTHLEVRGMPRLSDDEFEEFCRDNPDLKIEQNAEGEIIIMPPTGGTTGIRNFEIIGQFYDWFKKKRVGKAFDSSTTFVLPNGAKRSPDLSWIKIERWQALTKEEQDKFPPLCPDFVVELRSKTDSLKVLQGKMREYIENGAQLGWLIDPIKRKVYIYRPNQTTEILNEPEDVSGEPLLPKFTLKLKDFWE